MTKKMISLEIPDNLREALRVRAFKENVSISEIIRRVLTEQLKSELVTTKIGDSTENENRFKD